MTHVKQKDRSGCGIACVAMLAGKTYDEVRLVFLAKLAPSCEAYSRFLPHDHCLTAGGNGAGITRPELNRLLAIFGVAHLSHRIREVELDFGGHYVALDEDGKIYDPAE